MDNSYTFSGGISIDPPLNYAQIKEIQADSLKRLRASDAKCFEYSSNTFNLQEFYPLTLTGEMEERETDEGVIHIQRAVGLEPSRHDEGYLSYGMAEQVNRIMLLCPQHTFLGEVLALSSDNLFATKVVVKDRLATEVHGRVHIHFEDGTQSDALES